MFAIRNRKFRFINILFVFVFMIGTAIVQKATTKSDGGIQAKEQENVIVELDNNLQTSDSTAPTIEEKGIYNTEGESPIPTDGMSPIESNETERDTASVQNEPIMVDGTLPAFNSTAVTHLSGENFIIEESHLVKGAVPQPEGTKPQINEIEPQDLEENKLIPNPLSDPPSQQSEIEENKPDLTTNEIAPQSPDGWTTIMFESFEGSFPSGSWSVFDNDGSTNGEYYWDDDDYKPYNGSWSAWAANGGANGVDPASYYYPNNAQSWMVYGPFNLSDTSFADLSFFYWNQSEYDYDWFGWYASTNGSNFYGYRVSGDSSGWNDTTFDLSSVPTLGDVTGNSNVWIAFIFTSDISNVDDGPFVDDILLQKFLNPVDPNLTAYTPSGWDYPIVPSSVSGTHTVNSLYADLTTYIDWAVINNGGTDIAETFYTCLYYDGSQIECWYKDGLLENYYTYVEDFILNLTPTVGWHTLKIIADVYDDVSESNEGDNEWQRDFYWGISATNPNLTAYTPSGWDYPIVPTSVTGTNTVGDLYSNRPTYIDWAIQNNGTADIGGVFYSCLYFDDSPMQCWYKDGLPQNYYTWVEDWLMNISPTQGWHTLKIIADVYDDVAESNEFDNEYQLSFYWDVGPDCTAVFAAFDNQIEGKKVHNPELTQPSLVPPHPDLWERYKRGEVELPEFIMDPTYNAQQGIDQPLGPAVGPTGSWNALALLVEFTDNPSQVGATSFDTLLFGTGTSTMRDYFNDVSYGVLDIVTVNLPSSIGWCTMPETYAYYVDANFGTDSPYPNNAQRLAEDAVLIADPYVDFSQYDNDSDGWVDTVFIIHAGRGAETTLDPDDIWSHSWATVNDPVVDGVTVNSYTTEPEFMFTPGDMTIGVYAHELGHVFGLPDLYDTDYSSSGVGDWSLMGSGSWNGTNGDSPAWLDAWSRAELGYVTPNNVTDNMLGASIPAAESSQTVYRLWTNGSMGSEYFLVENRQSLGYDSQLPSHGLLIWHIDEVRDNNRSECTQLNNWNCGSSHFKVAIEQADGLWDLENANDQGDTGDPFPGSTTNRNFTFTSTPNSSSYYGSANTYVRVENISNSSSTMTADLKVKPPSNPDSYEPDDNSGQANWIFSGSPQNHSIVPAGDEDWVKFSLSAESEVVIETSGASGDTRMWLYDSGLTELEYDDDDGSGTFSRIDRVCNVDALPAGTYYVKIDEYGDNNVIPSYDISLAVVQTCINVGPLVYNSHTIDDDNSGNSSGNGDGVANCGETIELYVDLFNQGSGVATGVNASISTSDPYVTWIINTSSDYPDIPGGSTGTNSDDFDFDLDPSTPNGHSIQFNLDITTSNGGPWSDTFSLPVTCITGDSYEPDDNSGQASWIYDGSPQTHSLVPAGDEDWVKFTLSAESEVVIETSGASGDTRMWLYDSGLTELEYDDDDGSGTFSRINRVCNVDALPAGTYYVKIDEYGDNNVIPSYDISLAVVQTCINVGPLVYNSHTIDDDNSGNSSGNGDGVANCGETIELYVDLFNQGSGVATGVNASISTSDPYVTWIINTSSDYPDIPGGSTGTNSDDFDFDLDPSTPNGHIIQFNLDINASNGGPWFTSIDVPVTCSLNRVYLPIVLKNH
ncbi:M6 family metalloprotease domain-containing protein [Chloroflexota bacterium]